MWGGCGFSKIYRTSFLTAHSPSSHCSYLLTRVHTLLILFFRKLIRTIRTVAVKNRKMYILEGITPAKELTGGVWYHDATMDRDRIEAIRTAAVQASASFDAL